MAEDYQMEDEYNARLRSSKVQNTGGALKGVKFIDQTSVEQFNTTVDAVFHKLNETGSKFININDIEYILDQIDRLDRPGYKNAVSYILGYYARSLHKKDVDKVFSELHIVNEFSSEFPIFKVSKQDVIRYARLWSNLINGKK